MTCCRKVFLTVTTLVAVAAVSLIWIGAVRTYNVSLANASSEQMEPLFLNFTRCSDIRDMTEQTTFSSDYANVVEGECIAAQAPYLLLYCAAGVFSFFATVSGIVAGCKQSPVSSYSYSIFSATSFALLVVSVAVMAIATSPVTSRLIPCGGFDYNTIQLLTDNGFFCISGIEGRPDSTTARYFIISLGFFYGGSVTAFLCMFLFLSANCCCTQRDRKSSADGEDAMRVPLQPQYAASYGAAPYQPYQSGQYV